jgi:DEAD/DEAH box helicase domain-containing protein
MPENEMHTCSFWLSVARAVISRLPFELDVRRVGVVALSYTLGQMASLYLMCDRWDLGVAIGDNGQGEARVERGLRRLGAGPGAALAAPTRDDYEPQVFVYDNYPGGIGLAEPLYRLHDRLLRESLALIRGCGCRDGCPSCVGPLGEVGSRGKMVAVAILEALGAG